jgi:hypothetical protein
MILCHYIIKRKGWTKKILAIVIKFWISFFLSKFPASSLSPYKCQEQTQENGN